MPRGAKGCLPMRRAVGHWIRRMAAAWRGLLHAPTRSRRRSHALVLALVILAAAGYASFNLFSTGDVFGRGRITYISPNGLINQGPGKPTSFGDADDLKEIGP